MTHKIISINGLRIAVTFLQGTFHPKHSTAICFEVSLFDISVELSPFAVKSMFWLSSEPIRLQEITYPDLVVARTDNIHRSGGGSWWLFTEAAKRIFIGLPAVSPIKFSLASRLSPKKEKRRTQNPEVFAYPVLIRPSVASEEKSFPFPAKVVG